MAGAVLRSIKYPNINVKENNHSSSLKDKGPKSSLSLVDYSISYINDNNHKSIVTDKNSITHIAEVLPFRVRFQNTRIGGYSPSNPAPIGIAVIGINNYIL
jgi:hypothetical protein